MERWSEAKWVPAISNAGRFTGGAAKGLLHTTEGGTYLGALATYRLKNFWPHATLTFENRRFEAYQHLDLDVAGSALEHPRGTGATNTDHVIQVEIVGSADRAWATKMGLLHVEDFPVEYLAGIARWMRYVERVAGVLPLLIAPFGPPGTVRRLTWPEWHGASGWCGHCHVPGNNHSDPGNIPIRTLIPENPPRPPRPSTPLPPSEEDMPRIFIDPKGPDDIGRDSFWEVEFPTGNMKNWNGARPLKSLNEVEPDHVPIVGAVPDPSGDGLVLIGNDARRDERGHWVVSTYKILAGS